MSQSAAQLKTQPPLELPPGKKYVPPRDIHHDDGEGNWLISYADMMTLLFAFFALLSVFSTPNAAKMEKLKQETAASMGTKYEDPYEKLAQSLLSVLRDFKLDSDVELRTGPDGIELVSKGTLFFDSASTELKQKARDLMSRIGDVLAHEATGLKIVVEGHTDDVPISTGRFPSNWELSSNRASTVVRLLEERGVDHTSLRPVGLSDTRPVVANRDPAGIPLVDNQARNRRIVVRVQRQLKEEATDQ